MLPLHSRLPKKPKVFWFHCAVRIGLIFQQLPGDATMLAFLYELANFYSDPHPDPDRCSSKQISRPLSSSPTHDLLFGLLSPIRWWAPIEDYRVRVKKNTFLRRQRLHMRVYLRNARVRHSHSGQTIMRQYSPSLRSKTNYKMKRTRTLFLYLS